MQMEKKSKQEDNYIEIKGAKVNNLANINVKIPREKFIIIAGVSGSGKSSLAFDTLYAEGQRRYVESLSAYARQFLGRMSKPEVDFIKGLPPAIAIEQKVIARNPRSTVGTSTEIYEYLRLLYARIGRTFSPKTGEEVKRHTVEDVIEKVKSFSAGTKFCILAPLNVQEGRSIRTQLEMEVQEGYARIYVAGDIVRIEDWLESNDEKNEENAELSPIIKKQYHVLPILVKQLFLKAMECCNCYYYHLKLLTTSLHVSKQMALSLKNLTTICFLSTLH